MPRGAARPCQRRRTERHTIAEGTIERIEPIWRQLIEVYGMQRKIEALISEGNLVTFRFIEIGSFFASP